MQAAGEYQPASAAYAEMTRLWQPRLSRCQQHCTVENHDKVAGHGVALCLDTTVAVK